MTPGDVTSRPDVPHFLGHEEGVAPEDFRAALARLSAGVGVLTGRDDAGRDVGMTVSSVMSASLVPPLVVVAVNARASAYPAFVQRATWGVSFLDGSSADVADVFAQHHTERTRSPFEAVAMRPATRIPVLLVADALATVECVAEDSLPLGDHVLLVGRVVAVSVRADRPGSAPAGSVRGLLTASGAGSSDGAYTKSGPLIRYARQYGTFGPLPAS